MIDEGRRKFLRVAGAVAAFMPGAAKSAVALSDPTTAIGLTSQSGLLNPSGGVAESKAISFKSFAKWWSDFGEDSTMEEAKSIHGFDADILDRHLPMATKVRLQTERNYDRIKKRREREFSKSILSTGEWKWWP